MATQATVTDVPEQKFGHKEKARGGSLNGLAEKRLSINLIKALLAYFRIKQKEYCFGR